MKILLSLTVFLLLTGCVPFPTYKTLQPHASIKVVDPKGEPINGAKVELISSSYPYGHEKFRTIGRTRFGGEISVAKTKQWRMEMPLMIHGAEFYFWNWCVSKDGYETVRTRYTSSDEFKTTSLITLYPGKSRECPDEYE
jgi:hypothetical protein